MFIVKHKNTIYLLCPYAPHAYVRIKWKILGVTHTSDGDRSSLQVGGAQGRSMVHNLILYSRGGEQCRSHKLGQTDEQTVMHMSPPCIRTGVLKMRKCLEENYRTKNFGQFLTSTLSFISKYTVLNSSLFIHFLLWWNKTGIWHYWRFTWILHWAFNLTHRNQYIDSIPFGTVYLHLLDIHVDRGER